MLGLIRVALVDDHPIVRAGVRQLLEEGGNFSIVSSGCAASDIIDIAQSFSPDVIVVDLGIQGKVLDAIRQVVEAGSSKVLVFTASASIDHAVASLEAGALGYVLKTSSLDELKVAVATVSRGETYITPSFAAKVVAGLRGAPRRSLRANVQFSRREEQVLRLLLCGSTNKEIAEALSISDKTVKHYMTILMQKLNARNRTGAVLAAQKLHESARQPSIGFLN